MATDQLKDSHQFSIEGPLTVGSRDNLRNLLELANSEITLFTGDETLPVNRLLLDAFLALLSSKRPDLFAHSQRVALLCFGMGRHIGWSHRHTLTLSTAAMLHQLGSLAREVVPAFWSTVNTSDDLQDRKILVDLLQACHADSDLLDLIRLSHNFAYRHHHSEETPRHVLEGAACLQLADLFDSVRQMPHSAPYTAEEIIGALKAITDTPDETQAIEALQEWFQDDPKDRESLDPEIFRATSLVDDPEMQGEVREIFLQILRELKLIHDEFDGYFLLDSTGHFQLWSTGCAEVLGRSVREMRNRYWTNETIGYCNHEGLAFSDARTPLYQTLETAQVAGTTLFLRKTEEELVECEVTSVPLLGRDRTLQGIVELHRVTNAAQRPKPAGEILFTPEWISELAGELSQNASIGIGEEEDDASESAWDSFLMQTESSLNFHQHLEPPEPEELGSVEELTDEESAQLNLNIPSLDEASDSIAAPDDVSEAGFVEPAEDESDEQVKLTITVGDAPEEESDAASMAETAVEFRLDRPTETHPSTPETPVGEADVDALLSRFDRLVEDVEQGAPEEFSGEEFAAEEAIVEEPSAEEISAEMAEESAPILDEPVASEETAEAAEEQNYKFEDVEPAADDEVVAESAQDEPGVSDDDVLAFLNELSGEAQASDGVDDEPVADAILESNDAVHELDVHDPVEPAAEVETPLAESEEDIPVEESAEEVVAEDDAVVEENHDLEEVVLETPQTEHEVEEAESVLSESVFDDDDDGPLSGPGSDVIYCDLSNESATNDSDKTLTTLHEEEPVDAALVEDESLFPEPEEAPQAHEESVSEEIEQELEPAAIAGVPVDEQPVEADESVAEIAVEAEPEPEPVSEAEPEPIEESELEPVAESTAALEQQPSVPEPVAEEPPTIPIAPPAEPARSNRPAAAETRPVQAKPQESDSKSSDILVAAPAAKGRATAAAARTVAEPVSVKEWDAFAEHLLEGFHSRGDVFSVLFIDVDHFTTINKEFGRQIGDDLLRELGRRLTDLAGAREMTCRYGGEQFVFACPGVKQRVAKQRAETLRKSIAGTRFDVLPFHRLSVSIGVAEVEAGDEFSGLMDRAEFAVFRAKNLGRNCSVAVTSAEMRQPLPEGDAASSGKKMVIDASFDAFIAADMIVYKLGGFLYDLHAKLLKVDRKRVAMRVGNKGLIPYWGKQEESQPVLIELELGEDWDKAKSTKGSIAQTTIKVTIRPDGWVRKQDVFEHRANHVLRELKAHFAAT